MPMKKDVSDDEWELILAIRAFRKGWSQSPYQLEAYARDLFEELLFGTH